MLLSLQHPRLTFGEAAGANRFELWPAVTPWLIAHAFLHLCPAEISGGLRIEMEKGGCVDSIVDS
jgi:hypothetical protein